MKLFYLLSLFFCFQPLFAQLSVTPSKSGSSFLYVKDLVIYVDKGIHLEKNPDPATQASIYLRKEAQLIQGDKNNNQNSGNGLLSVFQEGWANAYNYNYWSLPVSHNSGGIKTAAGIIHEPITKTESEPVQLTSALDGKANPLSISKRWLYKFKGGQYADWEYIGDNFALAPGMGFTMKGVNGSNNNSIEGIPNNPGNRQRYDFRGKPNDGNIHLDIERDQVMLVGNPYPSALDLKAFLTQNTATTGIAYFWDHSNNSNSHYLEEYQGGYGAYSPGANAYVPAVFHFYDETESPTGETGDFYGREFSPIGQGFMLIGKSKGQVTFKNSYRIFKKENTGNSEFRTGQQLIPKLRLNISFNNLYVRQLLIGFRDDATEGIDHAMDAASFGALTTDAAWLVEEEPYLINVLPYDESSLIPLVISTESSTRLQISLENSENFNPEAIFIYDALEKSYHHLFKSDFQSVLEAGTYENRFFLSFIKEPSTEIELPIADEIPISINEKPDILYNKDLNQIEIMSPALLQEIQVFDLTGGLIFNKKVYENKQYDYFYTGNLREAVYIVKVRTRDNQITNKKLLLKK